MEDYQKDSFELGFESGVKRMAARLRNYIISNSINLGYDKIRITDVESIKRKILKDEEALNNG